MPRRPGALELASGLIADTAEYSDAQSFAIAAVLRARSIGHALAPMRKMPRAAPHPLKPSPIRSKLVKLAAYEPRLLSTQAVGRGIS